MNEYIPIGSFMHLYIKLTHSPHTCNMYVHIYICSIICICMYNRHAHCTPAIWTYTHPSTCLYTCVYKRHILQYARTHTHLLVYMSVCITDMYTAHLQYEPTHTLLLVYASMYIYNRYMNRTPATCNEQTHVCPRIYWRILYM